MSSFLQLALRTGSTPESLQAQYAIVHRRHRLHPNLVLFKYDMTESPMHECIVQESRGIILDEARDWAIVSRVFDKFFNHGEGHAAEIDWSTARVQEKCDGSLAVVYEYAGAWQVATSGTPDAGGNVDRSGLIFADYFWDTFRAHGGVLPVAADHRDWCFAFELMGPANRIVVVHPEPHLALLAVRNRVTGLWGNATLAAGTMGVPEVRSFPIRSIPEILASFGAISPLSQEGYVVVDGAGNRLKVKHPGYVALHHAKDGMSERSFVEIARSGETSEVVAAFPEFGPLLEKARVRVAAFVSVVEADYARLAGIEGQKAFALEAVKTRCPAALFAVRAKKAESVRAFVRAMPIYRLVETIGASS